MFNSLVGWQTLKFKLLKFDKLTVTGTTSYKEPIEVHCAIERKIVKIINKNGEEVKSHTQIYTDYKDVTEHDMIMSDYGYKQPIEAIHTFYDFNTGDFSMHVIYL